MNAREGEAGVEGEILKSGIFLSVSDDGDCDDDDTE